MALALGPINRLALRLECAEGTSGLIFDNEIRDWGPFTVTLRARLDIDVRHIRSTQSAFDKAALRICRRALEARAPSRHEARQRDGLASLVAL
jgi:hypothetical protein